MESNARALKTRATEPASAAAPAVPDVFVEGADPEITAFQEHQRTAARPEPAEQARTMMHLRKNAVLSTLSSKKEAEGFPFTSVIEFATTPKGEPIFAASSLSPHTADLLADGRCCITIVDSEYRGPQDSRLSVSGVVRKLEGQEAAAAREQFRAKHPQSFWVDFGDFSWFCMDDVRLVWLVAGFGGGRKITAEQLAEAQPDPVAQFSGPVCGHMNADHEADTIAMVAHYVGLTVQGARILDLDRLGMNLEVTRNGQTFKLRLPYSQAVQDRKGIKDAIVEMTKAARAAARRSQEGV